LSAGSSNKPVFFQVPLQVNRKAFTFQIIGLFLAPCLNFIPNKCSSQITEAELRMLLTGNAPSTTKIQLQFMFMNFFFLLEISMQLCSRQFIKYGVLAEVHVFTRVVLFSVLSGWLFVDKRRLVEVFPAGTGAETMGRLEASNTGPHRPQLANITDYGRQPQKVQSKSLAQIVYLVSLPNGRLGGNCRAWCPLQ
jgi:hypothetical protein